MGAFCSGVLVTLVVAGVAALAWYEYRELKKDMKDTERYG
jgi:hypothetical protein